MKLHVMPFKNLILVKHESKLNKIYQPHHKKVFNFFHSLALV